MMKGCSLLVCGRLADIHGRKKVYLLGMLWLIGFTLGCGFATST
jgi:MFS family permease